MGHVDVSREKRWYREKAFSSFYKDGKAFFMFHQPKKCGGYTNGNK
ncbi:hypothetical protein B4107_2516 [Bacillus safensis]|nr:hypothetical protein B4107_2516 [Bacillus safensis]